MIPLEAEVSDLVFRGKAIGVLGVFPLEIDSGVQVTLPVFSDVLVFFGGILKVVGMTVANIFNTKVVEDEAEEDRVQFMATKTGSGGALVVSMLV